MSTRHFSGWITLSLTIAVIFSATIEVQAQGIYITGVGPVNRSMAGAGTAAPLDSIGALYWNPASISGLPSSEMAFGAEMLLADIDLSSSVGNAKTSGEPGVAVVPSIGWVHHLEGTPMTIGLGMYGVGGFRNNMPFDAANPLLNGTIPGVGPLYADAELLQITPTVSYALTDRLAVGIAPTITAARIMLDPLGPPVTPGPLPSAGTGNRVHWGGGVQVGLFYMAENDWNLGFTIKSPQWFEDFRFFTPTGVTKFKLDLPMILSLGAAYTGKEDWIFAVDVRYFDWDNTDGFSEFNWKNTFAAAIGAQYSVNECWDVRFGYNFNQNPISANDAALNLSDPLIQEQNVSMGASYHMTENVDLTMAYVYLVNNSLTGPSPLGGTLSHEIDAHSAVFGVTVGY